MKPEQYAEALYLAVEKKSETERDAVLEKLRAVLVEHRHVRLLPAIVREYEKLVRKRSASVETTIRVARAGDRDAHLGRITEDVTTLDAVHLPEHVVIDEQVIGGYEVRAHGKRIDRTYRRMLNNLYSNLVSQS